MRENLPSRNTYCEFCCIPSLLHRYIGSNVLVNLTSLNFMCCTWHATSTGVMGHVNSFMVCPRIMSTGHFHCLVWVNYVWVLMADILNFSNEQLQTIFRLLFLCALQVLCYEYAVSRDECTKEW